MVVTGPSSINLKELRIAECPNLTTSVLRAVVDNCVNLEVFIFYNTEG